jgi:hypothetical protein
MWGHSIGHSKQKLYMYMCPIPNRFRGKAIPLHSSKTAEKKEIYNKLSTEDSSSSYNVSQTR